MLPKLRVLFMLASYAYDALTVALAMYRHVKTHTTLLEQWPKWRKSKEPRL
jgi:hypothetical protein